MQINTNYTTEELSDKEHDFTVTRGDACRTPSCHSRIHVRDVISERGSVTLCRSCRNRFFEVSS